jgi:hypothetical protein
MCDEIECLLNMRLSVRKRLGKMALLRKGATVLATGVAFILNLSNTQSGLSEPTDLAAASSLTSIVPTTSVPTEGETKGDDCLRDHSCSPQVTTPVQTQVLEKHPVFALPGKLDDVEVFNSNSPEIVKGDGLLLSTFPGPGMAFPGAHLNHSLRGRIDFFLHHINNRIQEHDTKTVQLGLIVQNTGKNTAHLRFLSGATYVSQPDAPFIVLPDILDNTAGNIYAGPGDRVAIDVLMDKTDKVFPKSLCIEPGNFALIFHAPIGVAGLQPLLNGRTALFRIHCDQPIYAALLSKIQENSELAPKLSDWTDMLKRASLVQPREKAATAPDVKPIIYGRVAGVSVGSTWSGNLINQPGQKYFDLLKDQSFSAVIDSLTGGTFATGQIQTAPLACRYSDTAYSANGNYGVLYKIHIPFRNTDSVPINVTVTFDTPIKKDSEKDSLSFLEPPSSQVFFRGTLKTSLMADGEEETKYTHLVEHRGEQGDPLVEFRLAEKKPATLNLEFIYPADATPPHVITVKSEAAEPGVQ